MKHFKSQIGYGQFGIFVFSVISMALMIVSQEYKQGAFKISFATSIVSAVTMGLLLLLYSFGLNESKPLNGKCWPWIVFAWSIILASSLASSGLILIIQCHKGVCNQIIGITSAGMMLSTAALCSGYLAYLQYPHRRASVQSIEFQSEKKNRPTNEYIPVEQLP